MEPGQVSLKGNDVTTSHRTCSIYTEVLSLLYPDSLSLSMSNTAPRANITGNCTCLPYPRPFGLHNNYKVYDIRVERLDVMYMYRWMFVWWKVRHTFPSREGAGWRGWRSYHVVRVITTKPLYVKQITSATGNYSHPVMASAQTHTHIPSVSSTLHEFLRQAFCSPRDTRQCDRGNRRVQFKCHGLTPEARFHTAKNVYVDV